jgi:hypothetical protein
VQGADCVDGGMRCEDRLENHVTSAGSVTLRMTFGAVYQDIQSIAMDQDRRQQSEFMMKINR